MDVTFSNDRLHKLCNSASALQGKCGTRMTRVIQRRLVDLQAVDSLETMRSLPGRCHELSENLIGHFSLDLVHPKRLVFKPANEPMPVDASGRLDWSKVTEVEVIGIGDYHS